jgi:NADP-dependent 3-hydroxy acid dehydrogenase YdfG
MARPVALVTGASSGIGEAACRELLRRGFTVYAAARRIERMASLQRAGAHVIGLDVTSEESLQAAIRQIEAEAGGVDVLVDNAGYGSYGAIEQVPLAEARRQFEVNVFGAMRLVQLVLPHMRQRGRGRILLTSSMGAHFAMAMGGWYHATKYAVEALGDALRQEVRGQGVDVVLIQPGLIRTEGPGIAAEHLRESGEGGPYRTLARGMAGVLTLMARPGLGSAPAVVARAIGTAATVPHPRPRYQVGRFSKAVAILARLLPARAIDAVVLGLERLLAHQR